MNISRRSFIKAGVAGSAALGLSSQTNAKKWFKSASADNVPSDVEKFTYHTTNCGGRCAFICTVRDGKLAMIQPNNWHDSRLSTVCLKGLSEIERVYSPDRIQTPLKRVGERGEGKFVPISWDEALTEVAHKLGETIDNYGGDSILMSISSGVEHIYPFMNSLLGTQHVIELGIDVGFANGLEECIGGQAYAYVQNETSDWVNTNTLILIGCNILETTLTDSQFFFDAKESGTKIIVIDPNYSTTAAHADQWISIKPGMDGALMLGMISIILENEWYDEDFLIKNTDMPFLVREDNDKILRVEDNDEEDIEKNPYLVWDTKSKSAKPYNEEGIEPALEGSFEVDGVKVKTAFTLLKENHKQYTLTWTSEKTEIEEEVIYELTKQYATRGPAVFGWGFGGADKWTNADVVGHSGGILGGLTGNFGRVGGAVGCALYHGTSWSASLNSWPLPEWAGSAETEMTTPDLRIKENKTKVLFNVGNTIQQHFANFNLTKEWIKSLDFVVTVDPFHNPSADLADIVLPASTPFESEYDIMNMQINRSHVLLSEKVIEPLHESKSDFQIEKELLEKLGLDQHHPPTPEEWQREKLASGDPALDGITVDTLQENKFLMRLNVPDEPYRGFMDQEYLTPTKKLELYHEKMAKYDQALPNYDAPSEVYDGNPLMEKYPLQFNQAHTRYRVHSQFVNTEWINQLDDGNPRLDMNPVDAKARDLENGDVVEIYNDRGHVQAKVKYTEAMRPGQIRLYEGWWSKHMLSGNLQNVTNDKLIERQYLLRYGPVIPYNDTLVEVKKV